MRIVAPLAGMVAASECRFCFLLLILVAGPAPAKHRLFVCLDRSGRFVDVHRAAFEALCCTHFGRFLCGLLLEPPKQETVFDLEGRWGAEFPAEPCGRHAVLPLKKTRRWAGPFEPDSKPYFCCSLGLSAGFDGVPWVCCGVAGAGLAGFCGSLDAVILMMVMVFPFRKARKLFLDT
jgi:hypothetical protein